MDLDVIVKCRMSGDYSLGISAEGGTSRKLKKAWRIYRYKLDLLTWVHIDAKTRRCLENSENHSAQTRVLCHCCQLHTLECPRLWPGAVEGALLNI